MAVFEDCNMRNACKKIAIYRNMCKWIKTYVISFSDCRFVGNPDSLHDGHANLHIRPIRSS